MELLAPAGNWESFLAAIENGADAVYLGGKQFSARQYAVNFSLDEIKKAVEYAHIRGRKVYVTVNTLVDGNELQQALDYVFELQALGIDAVIIQDQGLLSALRRVFPDLRLHASTQVTIHNSAGARFLKENGVKRVVLSRELSESDVRAIRQEVEGIELEIFVHGALCYCYSGQCLFSSMVGGRSGNRGRCAQPCRLPYQLRSMKTTKTASKGEFLLSPADLCLIDRLPSIQSAGVDSLKIEGRMKRPEYVATVTRIYREALKRVENGDFQVPDQAWKELATIFNRNFTTGYWQGRTPGVLSTTRPNNRGVYVGRVIAQDPSLRTRIKLKEALRVGDGIEIWVSRGKNPAAVVNDLRIGGQAVKEAASGSEAVVLLPGRVSPGDRVFKTHDARLVEEAARTIEENRAEGRVPVKAQVFLGEGSPLRIVLTDEEGNQVEACTDSRARAALTHPLTREDIYDKINRLGNTPFFLRECDIQVEEGLMVPFSEVNEARRQAVIQLIERRLARTRPVWISSEQYWNNLLAMREDEPGPTGNEAPGLPLLAVFTSQAADAIRAIKAGADRVYLGLEGLGGRDKIGLDKLLEVRQLATSRGKELVLALPRITKPFDIIPWSEISKTFPDGVMVGNPGTFVEARDKGFRVFCDYSLNVFNPMTARFWLKEGGTGICLSPELSFRQLENWSSRERSVAEVLVHGEIILMVSEYCMLREALGWGEKPCEKVCRHDTFNLRDRRGYDFPVETDARCRAYVFNSRTLCMVEDLPRLIRLGFGSLRIEARRGDPGYIEETVHSYRLALDALARGGKVDLTQLQEELRRVAPSELTKLHYYRGVL